MRIINKQEILQAIRSLAQSQGFYGRLYERLINDRDQGGHALDILEDEEFGDILDMVMFLET